MGQKVNPIGLRIGITKTWDSKWYAEKRSFTDMLNEDIRIRRFLKKDFYQAGISRIEIERVVQKKIKVVIHALRPGIIIGRSGQEIERIRRELQERTGKEMVVDIKEVRRSETDAQMVAENVALQIERRVAYKRAMKQAISSAMRTGALGIKIMVSGRLAGAEIARREWYKEGGVPLTKLRADIDYGFAEAKTKYGIIGIKTWIFKGEIIEKRTSSEQRGEDVTA
ncbi:MAG: 30S ribosomal protein S3 [Candidatus Mycalebacterium zealandia]|nr:MAG: 30S ribosomal protein S3 [Candidatus Mycalebacterium zealandia]